MNATTDHIRNALEQDPDEFASEHRDLVEQVRDQTDDEKLRETIDAWLADLDAQEGESA